MSNRLQTLGGAGSPVRVELITAGADGAPAGGTLRGQVKVHLNDRRSDPVQVIKVTIRLVCRAEDARWGKDHTVASARLSGGPVTATAPLIGSFEHRIPDEGPVSSTGEVIATRWHLVAEVRLAWGRKAWATLPVVVTSGPLAVAWDSRHALVHSAPYRVITSFGDVALGVVVGVSGAAFFGADHWIGDVVGIVFSGIGGLIGVGALVSRGMWLRWDRHISIHIEPRPAHLGDEVEVEVRLPTRWILEDVEADLRCTERAGSSPNDDDEMVMRETQCASVRLTASSPDGDHSAGKAFSRSGVSVHRGRAVIPAQFAPSLSFSGFEVEWEIVVTLQRALHPPIVARRSFVVHPRSPALTAPAAHAGYP